MAEEADGAGGGRYFRHPDHSLSLTNLSLLEIRQVVLGLFVSFEAARVGIKNERRVNQDTYQPSSRRQLW
jgi:hypothetical protein